MTGSKTLFRPAKYFRPTTALEAVKLLEKYGESGRAVAGGTDLVVEKDPRVEALVDITGLGLDYIKSGAGGVRIGAASTFADIAASPALRRNPYSIVARAARAMGTPQVRNVATIGGNVCSAVPSAESAPPLLVLDATVTITGPGGDRHMAIADFFLGVRSNALKRDELLVEFQLPAFDSRCRAVFMKKGRANAADLAIVNGAVFLSIAPDGTCQNVRIALGAVAPTPMRARQAEALLEGQRPLGDLLRRVADRASNEIRPISDIRGSAEYRRVLTRVLVERMLTEAAP